MPIQKCQSDGKSGFRWGKNGKCYTYTTEEGKERARNRAIEQGRAIEARRKENELR